MPDAKRKVAVITGASSGIGRETAIALARGGWSVIGCGMNPDRCAEATEAISAAATGGRIEMVRADLSLLSEAAEFADRIAGLTDKVDVLLNNAGYLPSSKVLTAEGFEHSYALHVLSHYVLTERLLPLLARASQGAPAGSVRIINTTSRASEFVEEIDLDDLQNIACFDYARSYCAGKLGVALHAKWLARRLAGDGIVAHAADPGTVDSNFFTRLSPEMLAASPGYARVSVADGADTLVWLARDARPGKTTGGYWREREPRRTHPSFDDDAFVAQYFDAVRDLIDGDA